MVKNTWHLLLIISIPFLFIAYYGVYKARSLAFNIPQVHPPDVVESMKFYLAYLVVFTCIRSTFDYMFKERLLQRAARGDPINYKVKQHKIVKEVFGSFWYTVLSVLGYVLFYGSDMLPTTCGGTAPCTGMMDSYLLEDADWRIKHYFMLQLAFHTHTLVTYELVNRKARFPEYHEIMLHHFLATVLVALCYYCSFFSYGVTILVASDITDILLDFGKSNRDLKFIPSSTFETCLYLIMVVAWFFLRMYIVPVCLVYSSLLLAYNLYYRNYDYFNKYSRLFVDDFFELYLVKIFLLGILVILNIYWSYLILRIGYNRLFKKDLNFTNVGHGETYQQNNHSTQKSVSPQPVSKKDK